MGLILTFRLSWKIYNSVSAPHQYLQYWPAVEDIEAITTVLSLCLSSSLLLDQDAERQHREVVSIYRTHLLSAAQVRSLSLISVEGESCLIFFLKLN